MTDHRTPGDGRAPVEAPADVPDFRHLFESVPELVLVIRPDPHFTIVAASDAYLAATMTRREEILGQGLFEVFPDNPSDSAATGVANLAGSLRRAIASRQPDAMPVQRYDIRRRSDHTVTFEQRYWRPLNTPIVNSAGAVEYILHRVEDVTALVRAQQEADRHRVMTSQVKEYAIFMLDRSGRVVTWNAGAERLKGYRADEIIGEHFSVFYTQEDIASGKPAELLQRAVHDGQAETAGWRVRKNGSRFWANAVVTPIKAEDGHLIGFAKVTRDLTDQKTRIDLLQRWEHLFEHAQWGIATLDAGLQTLGLMNPAFAAMHGYTPEELRGRPLSQLIAPGHEAFSKENISLVIERGHHNFEVMHRRRDGSLFPVLVDASAVQTEDGTVLYETVQVQDITERKRQEDEQRLLADVGAVLASSLDHDEILRRIAQFVVPRLADCCIIGLVEESGLRRVAAVHREPEKHSLTEALKANPPDGVWPPIWNVLREGDSILQNGMDDEHLRLLAEDASRLDLMRQLGVSSCIAVPLTMRDRIAGAILLLAGVPRRYGEKDLRFAQEVARRSALAVDNARLFLQSQQAIHARDYVLGVVAHDLRNPLNVIKLSAQVIERSAIRMKVHDGLVRSAKTIADSVRTADRLIQDLLDVSRIEAGRLSLNVEPQSPAGLLKDVEMMRPVVEAASIELVADCDGELPDIPLDRDRFRQVISNLIGNATKFTPPGGRIEVRVEDHGQEVWFAVSDTGPGIPKEQEEHLFDRFWQAKPADRRGLGLGLAISKGIVEAHHGRLWVESRPGQGATFIFALPVTPPTPEYEGEVEGRRPSPDDHTVPYHQP